MFMLYMAIVVTLIGIPLLVLHLACIVRGIRSQNMPIAFGVAFVAYGLLAGLLIIPGIWVQALT